MSKKLTALSDQILVLKGEIKGLEAQTKTLKQQQESLEEELRVEAETLGLTSGKSANSQFTIEPSTVPQAGSWDEFYAFIHKKKYYHLLERRPSTTGCRELWEQGVNIPGIEKYTKIKVNVKSI